MKKSALTQSEVCSRVQKEFGIVGRENEISQIYAVLCAERNVLIEGPVGVGKTVLAQAVSQILKRKVIRVDGDSRFTEQKLTGWFDPSLVVKKGYSKTTFIAGPLVQAMSEGAILFINELNRMPEAVQNVLLPAMDEGLVNIPQLGSIKAKQGFLVVATQNPREFVATAHLSEALMDRMEWIQLHYQTFEQEKTIVEVNTGFSDEPYLSWAVGLVRLTREHPKVKRGASVRAAIALIQILQAKKKLLNEKITEEDFWAAAKLALPTRIELSSSDLEGNYDQQIDLIFKELSELLKKNS